MESVQGMCIRYKILQTMESVEAMRIANETPVSQSSQFNPFLASWSCTTLLCTSTSPTPPLSPGGEGGSPSGRSHLPSPRNSCTVPHVDYSCHENRVRIVCQKKLQCHLDRRLIHSRWHLIGRGYVQSVSDATDGGGDSLSLSVSLVGRKRLVRNPGRCQCSPLLRTLQAAASDRCFDINICFECLHGCVLRVWSPVLVAR